jgi:tape measure domain-containing protein
VIDQKQVELLIKARLQGGRDLESITKSIVDLEKALDAQAAAARRGESSFKELTASQEALKQVQQELGARRGALQELQKLTEQIEKQQAAVEKARNSLDAFNAKLGENRSDEQQARLQRLTLAYQNAEKRLTGFRQSFENLEAALKETGDDTSNVAAAIARVDEQVLAAATAFNRARGELTNYNKTLEEGKAAARDFAREQQLLQRLQAGNEADARLAADQRVAAIKKIEQAEADRLAIIQHAAQFEQQRRGRVQADSELAAIRESEEFTRRYLENQRKIEEANKRDAGLRKTADDAEAAARQYSTLARASTNLRPKIVSVADAIKQITSPAEKARETLDGVEKQIQELASGISKINGPVKDVADQFRNLRAAQDAISGQARLIDDFRKQAAALRATRSELSQARAQVTQYAAAVRAGGDSAQQFIKPLAEAEARVKRAAAALRDQIAVTRQSRDALRAAGIDNRNLGEAQERLARGARTATEATKQLTTAVKTYNVETTKGGAKGFSLFRDEGRTTLSLIQRIRGEVLALTAAYVGLQGVIGLAGDSLRAFTQRQGLANTLAFAFDTDATGPEVAEEIEYLAEQAERLGVNFEFASKSYAKFSAAARRSGAGLDETRFIFESFAEVARVINLTPDELNGLFNALGQSFSKGKIQAEELRQQIGERLPGAFAFAQEALKDVFPNLDKALEQGLVGAENLLTVAESIRRAAQGALSPALRSLDAEQQRFNNSVLFFKKEIADAGFADAYVNLLRELQEFFRSDDGKQFARDLSSAFSSVANVLRFLVENLELVKSALVVVVAAFAGNIFASIVTRGGAAAKAILGVSTALTLVQKAVLAFNAFVIGWQIGAYFRDKFVEVRLAGVALVTGFAELWSRIKFGAMELWEDLPRLISNAYKRILNSSTVFTRTLLTILKAGANALGLKGLGEGIQSAIDTLTFRTNEQVSSRVAEIRRQSEEDLKRIREIGNDLADEAIAAAQPQQVKIQQAGTTLAPPKRTPAGSGEASAADIAKRQREIEAITRALEALDAKIDRSQTDTLSAQLGAIDTEYQALARRIQKLGGEQASQFLAQLETAVGQLKLQTTRKFNDKLLAEQEAILSKIEQAEAASGRKEKDSLDARLEAIRKSYEGTYRQIADFRATLEANQRDTAPADEAGRRLDATIRELEILERQKFIKDELQRRESQVNDLLQSREARLRTIADKEAAGILTQQQADVERREVIAQLQPQIEALAALGREFALSIDGAFDPVRVQEFIDKLLLAIGSGERMNAEFDRTGQIIRRGIGQGIDNSLNALQESLTKVAQGTAKWGDVFKAVGQTILQTLADVLAEIAKAILRQQILIALRSIGVPVAHSGMVVGQGSNRSRNVSPTWFANAPRYHSGGLVGLRPDEYPAILQKNEEVLSKSDPRNVMNGGLAARGGAATMAQRFVLVDDRSRVAEAMAGAEGEQVTIMHLRKNLPTVRSMLKGG